MAGSADDDPTDVDEALYANGDDADGDGGDEAASGGEGDEAASGGEGGTGGEAERAYHRATSGAGAERLLKYLKSLLSGPGRGRNFQDHTQNRSPHYIHKYIYNLRHVRVSHVVCPITQSRPAQRSSKTYWLQSLFPAHARTHSVRTRPRARTRGAAVRRESLSMRRRSSTRRHSSGR